MDRNEEFIFAGVFLLLGLCVMVLFGRAVGLLVGGCFAGLAFLSTPPGGVRVAALTLVCLAGIGTTVHGGATPEFIVDDLARLVSGQGGLEAFLSLGPDSVLRVGFGFVGGGLCGLVLTLFSGRDGDGPSV